MEPESAKDVEANNGATNQVRGKKKSKKEKSKNKRKSQHFGDRGFTLEDVEAIGDASWLEVCHSCFVHTPEEWLTIVVAMFLILSCLYLFGLGLDFLGNGAKVMGGCAAGNLFGDATNPISGLMTGILGTVLLQSSSTTTAIIVGLVGAEDSIFTVQQGIYMVMGANIGTTVTNTIVSLGHFHDSSQLELAFGGATVHDIFNFLSVSILLPVEAATGYLDKLTGALVRGADTETGDKWDGPVKKLISPLGAKVLISNKDLINAVAAGGTCDSFYPIECSDPDHPTKKTCTKVGLIGCDKKTGDCPAFFQPDATLNDDQISGFVVFFIGLFVIFFALFALVQVLQRLLLGVSARVIYKATNLNGYLLIAIGTGVTMLLQSSSTTTSFFTPVVGMGALGIEQMYPITIGANIGTTLTSLLAAAVTDGNDSLQVALAHLMFNVTGMMIWYPIPAIRQIPITMGRRLGAYAKKRRSLTLVYLAVMYVLVPMIGLGISALFTSGSSGLVALASILVVLLFAALAGTVRWCYCLGGRSKTLNALERSAKKHAVMLSLSKDMETAKKRVARLKRYAMLGPPLSLTPEAPKEENADASLTKQEKQEALERLPDDIAYVYEAISTIMYHVGMPDDMDSEDPEDESPNEEEKPSLWSQVPKEHVAAFVCSVILVLFGLIRLFTNGSKGRVGIASFLVILIGLSLLWGIKWWYCNDGQKHLEEYFQAKRKQSAAIETLPRDMSALKSDIKLLLAHYKLRFGIDDGKDDRDATNLTDDP